MKKYKVEVVEKLSRVVEVEAEDYQTALEIVSTKYADSEIVLDYNDLETTDYHEYPSPKIKDNFEIVLEFDKDEKNIVISCDDSTGVNYNCVDYEDLTIALQDYIDNYIEYEKENDKVDLER